MRAPLRGPRIAVVLAAFSRDAWWVLQFPGLPGAPGLDEGPLQLKRHREHASRLSWQE